MSLFTRKDTRKDTRKETFVFKTEQQRDAYIEKLDAAHIEFEVRTIEDNIYSRDKDYILRVSASDLKKVS